MVVGAVRTMFNYGRRIANVIPELAISPNGQKVIEEAIMGTKGSVFNKGEAAWRALENHVITAKATEGGFFTRLFKSLREIPGSIKGTMAESMEGAKGFSKVLKGGKGLLKGIGRNLPLVGSIVYFLMEAVPNMFAAGKDTGVAGAAIEGGKALTKLAGAAAGAAIGSCIPGLGNVIGGIIGWIAGEKLTSLVVGKSYTEKKEEEAEMLAQAQEQQQEQQSVQQSNPFAQNPYAQNFNQYA